MRLYCLAFLLLVSYASAQAKPDLPVNYATRVGLVYTQGASGPLLADAYIPSGDGLHAGIVVIHGGGWVNGDRNQMLRIIKELASSGYVCFTIDYDVDPVHYPASFHQSLAAVQYLREHAAEFHLDADRVAVAGSSAGGELAALVALNPSGVTTPASPGAQAIKPVRAAIIFNGVLDLQALGDASSMVTQYLGGVCSTLRDRCADASPMTHVHAGAPPFFVGHGTLDKTVPFSQAEEFAGKLRAAGDQVRFFTAKDAGHTYWAKEEFFAQNVADIKAFLALALRKR